MFRTVDDNQSNPLPQYELSSRPERSEVESLP